LLRLSGPIGGSRRGHELLGLRSARSEP
jgi:hypothetical protein